MSPSDAPKAAARQAVEAQLDEWGIDTTQNARIHQHLIGHSIGILTWLDIGGRDKVETFAAAGDCNVSFMTPEVAQKISQALDDYYTTDALDKTKNNSHHPIIEQLGFTSILEAVDKNLVGFLKKLAAKTALDNMHTHDGPPTNKRIR